MAHHPGGALGPVAPVVQRADPVEARQAGSEDRRPRPEPRPRRPGRSARCRPAARRRTRSGACAHARSASEDRACGRARPDVRDCASTRQVGVANVTPAAVTRRATTGARAPRSRSGSPQRLRYDTSCTGRRVGHAPAPGRVPERHAAGHDPALAVGHAEDVERLAGVEEAEHARQRAADAVGAGGEHGAPHRRVDRPARRVVLDEPEQEQRHLGEVVGQPLGRPLHLDHLDALGVVGIGGRCSEAVGVDGDPQLGDGVR